MGALLGYSSSNGSEKMSIVYLLFYSGLIFFALSLKMSSAHAMAWGVYEKCRDTVLEQSNGMIDKFNTVHSDYQRIFEKNCWCPIVWVTKPKHYIFWPVANFLIPALPALAICYSEWSAN